MAAKKTGELKDPPWVSSSSQDSECLALMIAWSYAEPGRVGEVALFADAEPWSLGRGAGSTSTKRAVFVRQRPGHNHPTSPLGGTGVSREQLLIRRRGKSLEVENIGRHPLLLNGSPVSKCNVSPGDLLEIQHQMLCLVVSRPLVLPGSRFWYGAPHDFGGPDQTGIVGESATMWQLRDRLALIARSGEHVLIFGATGTGKELATGAIHALSSRSSGQLWSRNAAAIPKGIADAELFGNIKNYPNVGTPERRGLIGSAHGATLFLDEIGELPEPIQARLLRVLDEGEYVRLGDSRPRRSDFRMIGATNRAPSELKSDLLARFTLQLETKRLSEIREDIPLLAMHLAKQIIESNEEFSGFVSGGIPKVAPQLMYRLLNHPYELNARELRSLLWRSAMSSTGNYLVVTDDLESLFGAPQEMHFTAPKELSADAIRAALEQHAGNTGRVWRELNLSSRHVLYRLLKRHNISVQDYLRSES